MDGGPVRAIGVDVGGSHARVALVDLATGRVRAHREFPTGRDARPEPVLDAVADAALALCAEAGASPAALAGFGVGAPGPLDPRAGIVHQSPNMPAWRDVPVAAHVAARVGRPVTLQNDAACAAFGEWRHGAGQGASVMVCCTLGTGIGGGIVWEGRLLEGPDGTAGHVGHIPLGREGPLCGCGAPACVEAEAGAAAIVARYRAAGGTADAPAEIGQRAAAGEARARAVLAAVGADLGLACVAVVNLLNPDRIVFAGGVAEAADWILPAVRTTLERRALAVPARRAAVVRGALGPDAGCIGAAAWASR